jgi:hypothetical protein
MIKHGTRPAPLDARDYSFHRTFPHFGAASPAVLPPMDYSFDAGLTMPDQMADGYPYGCTGYAQTDCKTDQEKVVYLASYTYKKTCFMEGHDADRGCDLRNSAKSLRVYGAQQINETEEQAQTHKSGQSFSVDKVPGRDWFDSFRIALRAQRTKPVKNSISIGTIWFPEWGDPAPTGLLTEHFIFNGNINAYNWHDYKISGEKTIGGEPTLEVKSWQGRRVGADGWLYLNRAAFNKAFDIYGTLALTTAVAGPDDIRTIKLDTLQTILIFLNRILGLMRARIPAHA